MKVVISDGGKNTKNRLISTDGTDIEINVWSSEKSNENKQMDILNNMKSQGKLTP